MNGYPWVSCVHQDVLLKLECPELCCSVTYLNYVYRLIKALGPGERISLAKLAVDHLKRTARPIRIAIDISIWLFQVQASRGGHNPELRTLLYRLIRLVALPIRPVFVYDGPQRPTEKRGKRIGGTSGPAAVIQLSKRLVELFQFQHHTAPGEAEAECARMQMIGVVDAVISNDVDAIMFGSKTTILNFSKESSRSGAATHGDVYRTETSECGNANVKIDRGGMILFALLSGGDYFQAGVSNCGQVLATEIAMAGFGADFLQGLQGNDLGDWRSRLQKELHDNEEKHFKRRHKAVNIPDTFPDRKILSNYTDPIVSPTPELLEVGQKLEDDGHINLLGLRDFVKNEFGWKPAKFIRAFSQALISHRLRLGLPPSENDVAMRFCGQRTHFDTDELLELRLEFVPADVVGPDFMSEPTSSPLDPLENDNDDEEPEDAEIGDDLAEQSQSAKTPSKTVYDPTKFTRIWLFEAIAQIGMPEAVEKWKAAQQAKASPRKASAASKPSKARSRRTGPKVVDPNMTPGALHRYFPVGKSSVGKSTVNRTQKDIISSQGSQSAASSFPYSVPDKTSYGPTNSGDTQYDDEFPTSSFPTFDPGMNGSQAGQEEMYFMHDKGRGPSFFSLESCEEFDFNSASFTPRAIEPVKVPLNELHIRGIPPDSPCPTLREDTRREDTRRSARLKPVDSTEPANSPRETRRQTKPTSTQSTESSPTKKNQRQGSPKKSAHLELSSKSPASDPASSASSSMTVLAELLENKAHIDDANGPLKRIEDSKSDRAPTIQHSARERKPRRQDPTSMPIPSAALAQPSHTEAAIEAHDGFWTFTSQLDKTEEHPDRPIDKPSRTSKKDLKFTKSGKKIVAGRVSILDMSELPSS
ncbi:hypothetical protein AJ80_02560 [Polytolypa hystricis UAMH7299]|uniref:XPG-I domain-containing protein n=1 Tax=Polytolypa hystricis (strain UAMH7299) TaxID=1447883 RepID=A0A2B7YQZ5_POLH7|nr:hypothetical protein AJ80_02560 [Polytolypa hystricis UAMH7299]